MNTGFEKNGLVSVLLPAYNAEKFIEQSIWSILDQSYSNIELLILDDSSNDGTPQIIEKINDRRIKKYRFKKNKGNVFALNFLLKEASGDYIAFQDADDWSDLSRLEKQVNFLNINKVIGLCGTDYRYVESDGSFTKSYDLPTSPGEIRAYTNDFKMPPFCAASCMVRRSVYTEVGMFREYFNRIGCADFDWHFRIMEKFECSNLPEVLYFYRRNLNSITTTVSADIRKLVADKIAHFLFEERKEKGKDSLQEDNIERVTRFARSLLPEYVKDPSLIYYRKAISEIQADKFYLALKSACRGLALRPTKRTNISLFKYWLWKLLIK